MFQNSRQTKEHVESVLNAEREKWAQEKARSQQALRSAEAELARLREETMKDAVPHIPVSGHESDTEEITWPRAKVGSLYHELFLLCIRPKVLWFESGDLANKVDVLFSLGQNEMPYVVFK